MIRVWVYGEALERSAAEKTAVDLPEPTLKALYDALGMGRERSFILPIVNGDQAMRDRLLCEGDTIVLHIPISGG